MIIEKTGGVGGKWIDKKTLKNGDLIKLTSEAEWIDGQNDSKQLVAKARVKGLEEEVNLAINKPSKNALIDAFGKDSKEWIGKVLTVAVESGIFAGKRGIMLNLIPEGYEVSEDANGYIIIQRSGRRDEAPKPDLIQYPKEEINIDDIPF